jgi:hypothetical protein
MLIIQKLRLITVLDIVYVITFAFIGACGGSGDENGDSFPGPIAGTGIIQGRVVSSDGSPVNAVHVRAVNTSNSDIQLSAFSGIGPGLTIQNGVFTIDGVPAGNYRVLIEKLDGRSPAFQNTRYSSFVVLNSSPSISFPDEYFNGTEESSFDDPFDFTVINVMEDQTTQDINFITNDG